MKKEERYARALYESLENVAGEERERRFNNFIQLLGIRGHTWLLSRIKREFTKLVRDDRRKRTVVISTPSPLDEATEKKIKEDPRYKAATDMIHEAIFIPLHTPHLIGGFQVKTREHRLDASYKNKLIQFYKALVSH